MIATLGNLGLVSRFLTHPSPEAQRQLVDLYTRIIDVELAGDGMTGPFQQGRNGIAQRRSSAEPSSRSRPKR